MKNSFLSKIVTSAVILSSILNVYGVTRTYNTLTYKDIVLTLLIPYIMINTYSHRRKISKELIPFFLYVIIYTLISVVFSSDGSYLLRTLRYLVCLFYLVFYIDLIDYEFAKYLYIYVALFSALFLIIQVLILELYGVFVPGYITFLPTARSDMISFQTVAESTFYLRPRSIFGEPAYFGSYIAGALLIVLNEEKPYSFFIAMIYTIGVLLSSSTTGIASVTLVWILVVFTNRIKFSGKRIFLAICILTIIILYILFSNQYDEWTNRLQGGAAFRGRFSGYLELLFLIKYEISFFYLLFGHGLVGFSTFIAGYGDLIYSFGLVGLLIFFYSLIFLFIKSNRLGKQLIVLFLFLNIGTAAFVGSGITILLYFTFIQKNKYENNIK